MTDGIEEMKPEDRARQAMMEIDEILRKYNLEWRQDQEVDPALTEILKRLPSYFRTQVSLVPKKE